jgi:2-amino-4-hydroxy-6-hydroxymethyldihydropteridine diphosphokinase
MSLPENPGVCIIKSQKIGTMRYFLSLGSNKNDREKNIKSAVDRLRSAGISILSASSLYETEPVGIPTEIWFYNQVFEVETRMAPEDLLRLIKHIEEQLGRDRTKHLESRSIDIDILLAGEQTVNTQNLQIPHPRIVERNFVLVPLAEIASDVRHPILKEKIEVLQKKSKDRSIVKKI